VISLLFAAALLADATAHLKNGAEHLRKGERQQAVVELKQALAAEPQSAPAHMLLGQAYLAFGSPEMVSEAKAELQQALAIDPTLVWARFYLAKIYLDLGRIENANRELERANELKSGVPHILALSAETSRQLGDAYKATELAKQALAADREFSPAHYYMGLAYRDLGQEDNALREFEAAVQSKYVTPAMLADLASLYMQRRELTRAGELLSKAAALDPARPETHLRTGELLRLSGKLDRALEELKLATPSRGRLLSTQYSQRLEADVLYETGRVHEDRGDVRSARDAYEGALNVLPEHRATRERLSRLP
jgi:tetratricopeptide (TPR) repeat protein